MGDRTGIEWTDATWNPVTGCSKVSQGCKFCYAERDFHRPYPGRDFTDVRTHPERLDQPLRWRKPRRIFVNSMSDLFHEKVPFEFIDQVFAVMALAPGHSFQILTKRPQRTLDYFVRWFTRHKVGAVALNFTNQPHPGGHGCDESVCNMKFPLPNVWLGVSVEDQATADERIPLLLQTPAAVRFVSYEPALGPVKFSPFLHAVGCPQFRATTPEVYGTMRCVCGPGASRLAWIIAGGESGPQARPSHPDWFRSVRDQCQAAGVPFFFKQWGEWTPGENVKRSNGMVPAATLFDGGPHQRWLFAPENLACTDGHIDDEPDVYRVGKKAAGRLLDGRDWSEFPAQ